MAEALKQTNFTTVDWVIVCVYLSLLFPDVKART